MDVEIQILQTASYAPSERTWYCMMLSIRRGTSILMKTCRLLSFNCYLNQIRKWRLVSSEVVGDIGGRLNFSRPAEKVGRMAQSETFRGCWLLAAISCHSVIFCGTVFRPVQCFQNN